MRYTVIKPFTTPLHRFAAGATIDAAEIDGPLTAEDRVARGEIAPIDEAAPMPEPEPG